MGVNGYTGQLVGPFTANVELFNLIQDAAVRPVAYINHLGIQSNTKNQFYINGVKYEIGDIGIYELCNTNITSLYFAQDTDEHSIIDYTIIC